MAERIVDALELVDVDIEHRKLGARLERLKRALELLAEQRPVRQIGQRIIMGEMGDLFLGAPAFGDILDGGDPAARLQGLVDDLDRAVARRLRQLTGPVAESDIVDDARAERLHVAVKRSGFLAMLDQLLDRAALLGDVGRKAEHLDIGLVADHDPCRGVVEHKPLRDIVDGRAKLTPLIGQRAVKPLMALEQQCERQHQRRDSDEKREFQPAQFPQNEVGNNGGHK